MDTPLSAPLVSVVVATYRCDDYLRLALQSILAQTFTDFEVLVADDGAEEATRAVVEAFHDPRLIYYRNPERLGAAGNHWEAFRRARGEFVAILNHDDFWEPTFLERMLVGLRDPAAVVAFCDHDVIGPAGMALPVDTEKLSRLAGRHNLAAGMHRPWYGLAAGGVVAAAQAAVIRRSALDLEALPEAVGPAYDLWLNYLLARGGGGAFYVPARLASWRTHPASISMASTRSEWPAGAGACFDRMAADPLFAAHRRGLRHRAADCFAGAALAALRGGRVPEARKFALLALRRISTCFRALAVLGLTMLPPGIRRGLLRV